MKEFLAEWGVEQVFSCAYRHSGNGIVERNHRTIKRAAARSGRSVEEVVYWYNNSPMSNGVIPAEALYRYRPRLRGEKTGGDQKNLNSRFSVGDMVYVKPPNGRCTSVWKPGRVTKIVSSQTVEVDGVNRHVADLRYGWHERTDDDDLQRGEHLPRGVEIEWLQDMSADEDPDNDDHEPPDSLEEEDAGPRRSTRERKLPDRYGVYVTH